MITVGNLITRLQQLDPDLPVVVSGFDESGYDHIDKIEQVQIVEVGGRSSHCGQFDDVEWAQRHSRQHMVGEPFTALHLNF